LKVNARLIIAAIMGVLLVVSTGLVFVSTTRPASLGGGGELKPLEDYFPEASFTYPLAPGSVVEMRVESKALIQGEESGVEAVYKLKVEGFEWPEVNVSYEIVEGEDSGPGVITFSQLALPAEMLGSPELSLPVYIPGVDAGECLPFTLEREEGGVLVYRAAVEIGDYVVKVEAGYYGDTGVIAFMEVYVVGPDVRVSYKQETLSYEPGDAGAPVNARWVCDASGFSSDFRYVREGLALVEGPSLTYIGPREFREAIAGDAVYLVLDKRCPFCQIDWSHILKASEEVDIPFYAVIAGPLLGENERKVAVLEMNKAGVTGTPAFVAYKGGKIVDVRQGFMDWREIVEWVRSVYG
jgi:hypothetical protein